MEAQSISPRAFAAVVGVSESSVKRWVDAGRISVHRTAGGHRRIPVVDALRFIRRQGMSIVAPERLGVRDLVAASGQSEVSGADLTQALVNDDGDRVRGLLLQAYVAGTDPASLFDGPLSDAMAYFGMLHADDPMGILLEHRFTALVAEAIHGMRLAQPDPAPDARRALGGSPEADPYILPNLMAGFVCAEVGLDAVNLGPNLPPLALAQAARRLEPALVWVAMVAPVRASDVGRLASLGDELAGEGRTVVFGGRSAQALRNDWPTSVHVVASMTELADVAKNVAKDANSLN